MNLSRKIVLCILPLPTLIAVIIIYNILLCSALESASVNQNNVINVAGRQRMLSQRIAKSAMIYSTARLDVEDVKAAANLVGTARSHAAKTADLVGGIAISSNEQAQGISQINQGLSRIDKVTQENSAGSTRSPRKTQPKHKKPPMLPKLSLGKLWT